MSVPEAEHLSDPGDKLLLGHAGVHLDGGQAELPGLPAQPFGEHPVAFQQVVQGPVGIAGAVRDLPQRASIDAKARRNGDFSDIIRSACSDITASVE